MCRDGQDGQTDSRTLVDALQDPMIEPNKMHVC